VRLTGKLGPSQLLRISTALTFENFYVPQPAFDWVPVKPYTKDVCFVYEYQGNGDLKIFTILLGNRPKFVKISGANYLPPLISGKMCVKEYKVRLTGNSQKSDPW